MTQLSPSLRAVASTLASELPGLVSASAVDQPIPVPRGLQLLLPSTSWSWPTDANGTSSAALYDFCSWMPASSDLSQAYQASAFRFSDGYRSFLQCLVGDDLTRQASAAFDNQSYYTLVLYSESSQPALPAWNISQFPQAWLASVAGDPSSAGTIRVPLPDAGDPTGSLPGSTLLAVESAAGALIPVPLAAGANQYLEIQADAWGWITIRPSGWYDSSLVVLKRQGPYSAGNASQFFGPNGILRNLLTGICVALHPSVTVSMSPASAGALQQRLVAGTHLHVGGLVFDAQDVHFAGTGSQPAGASSFAPASPGSLVAVSASAAEYPIIIGATVAGLGPASGG